MPAAVRSRAALAALLGLAAACSAQDSATANLPPSETCDGITDCAEGRVCLDNRCVFGEAASLEGIAVELVPPIDSPYAKTQLLDVDLSPTRFEVALTLPKPAEFDSEVLDASGKRIPARLTVFGDKLARIPGRDLDLSVVFVEDKLTRLRILPGEYTTRVEPFNAAYPGVDSVDWLVRRSGAAGRKEFRLPAAYRKIQGVVGRADAADVKVPGMIVRAFSSRSGLPSTIATTAEDGAFTIDRPATDATTFRLIAVFPEAMQPAWGYEEIISVLVEQDRVVYPSVAETRPSDRVALALKVVDADSAPVAGCTVTLTASTGVASRVFRVTGTTDAAGAVGLVSTSGRAPLVVLAAKYIVDVSPPPGARAASTQLSLDLASTTATAAAQTIVTPRRVRVTGSVVTAQRNVPLARGQIQLEPLVGTTRIPKVALGTSGEFELWVDPGTYVARIEPAADTIDGEIIPPGFMLVEVTSGRAEQEIPLFTMPNPTVLNGLVVSEAERVPVPRTEVELFANVRGRLVSLGRTSAGTTGHFTLVLPKTLP